MGPKSELATVEALGNAQVVRFLTDSLLDPLEVEQISEQLHAAQASGQGGTMVVSLENISQLSTLMLSVLVSLREKAHARGGEVHLVAIPERVDYVLKLTRLDTAFSMHATVEDALASA